MTILATPISDKLSKVIVLLRNLDLPDEAELVDDVRRDCMAIERRAASDRDEHLETTRALHKEIRELKSAARDAIDTEEKAKKSASEILAILKSEKNLASMVYIDGVERFNYHHLNVSVSPPVFNALNRRKDCRKKGHTLKCGKFTIYRRKPSSN
jgi:hypothetical protein